MRKSVFKLQCTSLDFLSLILVLITRSLSLTSFSASRPRLTSYTTLSIEQLKASNSIYKWRRSKEVHCCGAGNLHSKARCYSLVGDLMRAMESFYGLKLKNNSPCPNQHSSMTYCKSILILMLLAHLVNAV